MRREELKGGVILHPDSIQDNLIPFEKPQLKHKILSLLSIFGDFGHFQIRSRQPPKLDKLICSIFSCFIILSLGICANLTYEDLDQFLTDNCTKHTDHTQKTNHWLCNFCNKSSYSVRDIKKHIEAKHVRLPPLICEFCQKPYKTRESLRKHQIQSHEPRVSF